MFIRIEISSGIPITRQIMDQVSHQIASGTLQPGDRLPSVRELARQLVANHNTIQRAYERLTTQGLLRRIHGRGTFVAPALAVGSSRGTPGRIGKPAELLREDIQRLADKATDLNIKPGQLQNLLNQAMTRAKQQQAARRKRA